MARDFIAVDRGQLLLMPPSLVEWLPEDHLVWTVLGAVEEMNLDRFNESYRLGGAGRPAYDPQVMVALLLYAYARGNRSSRGIERACWEDVAFKVITGMRTPDHSTIAEFRRRHETEIAELFDDVLGICREAGLVSVGVITIDGTKIKANASMDQNRSYSGLVKEILREAEEADRREDELYGEDRGDELPEQLRSSETRRQALADAKRRLAERKGRSSDDETKPEPEKLEMDLEAAVLSRPVLRRGGRIEWLRVARRELEAHRTRQGAPVPRDRDDRMIGALERLEENHRVDLAAVESYERWWATARDTKGRVLKGNSKPFVAPELPGGQGQPVRPGLQGDAHAGHPAAAGLQRPGRCQRPAGDLGGGDHQHSGRLRAARADVRSDDPRTLRTGRDRETGGGARRRRLLASPADANDQRAGDRGARPTGREHAGGQTPRLGGRRLPIDAREADQRPRARALRPAEDHDRAGIRADQIQPAHRPVHAKRPGSRAV
jgi:transposase